MNKAIIKKIKELKQTEIDVTWKTENKAILMAQIKGQVRVIPNNWKTTIEKVCLNFAKQNQFLFSRGVAFVLALTMALGGGIWSVKASENSLPGDYLYAIKLAAEKLQLNMADDDQKTELSLKFAGHRIEEISQLQKLPLGKEIKRDKLKEAFKNFTDDINKTKTNLTSVQDKNSTSQKIVQVAKLVDQKAQEYKDILIKDVKKGADQDRDLGVSETVDDAIKATKEVSSQAVDIMVKQQNLNPNVKEEVKASVLEKIDQITRNTEILQKTITELTKPTSIKEPNVQETVKLEDLSIIIKSEDTQGQASESDLPQTTDSVNINTTGTNLNFQELAIKPEEAKALLQQANDLAQNGDLDKAIEIINKTTEMIETVNDAIVNSQDIKMTPITGTNLEQFIIIDPESVSGTTSVPVKPDEVKTDPAAPALTNTNNTP